MHEKDVEEILEKLAGLKREIKRTIIGQEEALDQILTTFIAGGHCLLEGVPGLAKTLMVQTLASAVDLSFRRIQFTPDLMPTDVIGAEVLEEDRSSGKRFFKFNKGPLFTNILLADEINRTPPKTQSALLEAMQEHAVTYAGQRYVLDEPFFVLATQNPIEQAGTYPLPEAQLDRFLMKVVIDYPAEEAEQQILAATTGESSVEVQSVLAQEEILKAQQLMRQVFISEDLIKYVSSLVRASRPTENQSDFVKEWVRWGAGPRAGQAMILTAKTRALLNSRYSVTLEDIAATAKPVLRHRILVNFKGEAEGVSSDAVTDQLLDSTPKPKSPLL
mgnify:CR=1 FL=1